MKLTAAVLTAWAIGTCIVLLAVGAAAVVHWIV